jgi:hypothetical protein
MKRLDDYSPVILKDNVCYSCLATATKFCALDIIDPESNKRIPTSYVCCGVKGTDDDPICSNSNSRCIRPYQGPPT